MLGAAAAVWEDLRTHHILAALLDLPAPEECSSHLDGRGDDTSMSRSERERHMEWDSSASLPDDGRLDQEGVAGKGPTAKEHEGDHKAHCSSEPPLSLGSAHVWCCCLPAWTSSAPGWAVVAVCRPLSLTAGIVQTVAACCSVFLCHNCDIWDSYIVCPEIKHSCRRQASLL